MVWGELFIKRITVSMLPDMASHVRQRESDDAWSAGRGCEGWGPAPRLSLRACGGHQRPSAAPADLLEGDPSPIARVRPVVQVVRGHPHLPLPVHGRVCAECESLPMRPLLPAAAGGGCRPSCPALHSAQLEPRPRPRLLGRAHDRVSWDEGRVVHLLRGLARSDCRCCSGWGRLPGRWRRQRRVRPATAVAPAVALPTPLPLPLLLPLPSPPRAPLPLSLLLSRRIAPAPLRLSAAPPSLLAPASAPPALALAAAAPTAALPVSARAAAPSRPAAAAAAAPPLASVWRITVHAPVTTSRAACAGPAVRKHTLVLSPSTSTPPAASRTRRKRDLLRPSDGATVTAPGSVLLLLPRFLRREGAPIVHIRASNATQQQQRRRSELLVEMLLWQMFSPMLWHRPVRTPSHASDGPRRRSF